MHSFLYTLSGHFIAIGLINILSARVKAFFCLFFKREQNGLLWKVASVILRCGQCSQQEVLRLTSGTQIVDPDTWNNHSLRATPGQFTPNSVMTSQRSFLLYDFTHAEPLYLERFKNVCSNHGNLEIWNLHRKTDHDFQHCQQWSSPQNNFFSVVAARQDRQITTIMNDSAAFRYEHVLTWQSGWLVRKRHFFIFCLEYNTYISLAIKQTNMLQVCRKSTFFPSI